MYLNKLNYVSAEYYIIFACHLIHNYTRSKIKSRGLGHMNTEIMFQKHVG